MASVGVYPVFELEFKISTTGKISTYNTTAYNGMTTIAEIETFDFAIDGNAETWTPMELEGWLRRLMTGKGFAVTCSGKRNDEDEGNNYIAGMAITTGRENTTTAGIKFPNGDILLFDTVVNVGKDFGGDSVEVSALEFELLSDGKPVYLEAAPLAVTVTMEQVGGVSGTETTTGIKMTFNKDVFGLLPAHITLTNGTGTATVTTLSGFGTDWLLGIDATGQGNVTVKVAGLIGYSFPGTATTVAIYKKS